MVITLKPSATKRDKNELLKMLKAEGLEGRVIDGVELSTINIIGDESQKMDFLLSLQNLPYVSQFQSISSPYKVISREAHPDYNGEIFNGSWLSTEIRAGKNGQFVIGGRNKLALMVGPCSIDATDPVALREIATAGKELGVTGLRGGAFKPRSEPYTFRGHELKALELGRQVADEYDLVFVTEPVKTEHIDLVIEYADILQIGTRNANQGFYLDVAERTMESQKPILAKRGYSQYLLKEFLPLVLNIYDYTEDKKNPNMMLCLRGIRTFGDSTRYTLDAGDVPVAKYENILPVVGDPSHPAGKERYVVPFAKSLIAAGADGLLVEVYPHGKTPLSDTAQHIDFKGLEQIVTFAKQIGRM